jgi:hypothetical protein
MVAASNRDECLGPVLSLLRSTLDLNPQVVWHMWEVANAVADHVETDLAGLGKGQLKKPAADFRIGQDLMPLFRDTAGPDNLPRW